MAVRQPRFALTEEHISEHSAQRTIVGVLRLELGPEARTNADGVTWWCQDHANTGGEVPGIRVGRGIPPGIFDMIILFRSRAFWIELKARDGILSEPQRDMGAALLRNGCEIAIAHDEGDVLRCLDAWQIPRRRRVKVAA